jgi:hypothetical protein
MVEVVNVVVVVKDVAIELVDRRGSEGTAFLTGRCGSGGVYSKVGETSGCVGGILVARKTEGKAWAERE